MSSPSIITLPSHETRSNPRRRDTHRDDPQYPASRMLPFPTSNTPILTHKTKEGTGNRKRESSQVPTYNTKQSKLDRSHP